MTDAAHRARLLRMMNEPPVRADDLSRLFLFLRDRCDGREAVQEIGDFVAHYAERTKGLVTRSTKDWAVSARFATAALTGRLDPSRLPDYYPEFLAASLRRMDARSLKSARLSSATSRRILPRVVERMTQNSDGTWKMPSGLNDREQRLVSVLSSYLVSKPAFDDKRLIQDFKSALMRQGLLEPREVDSLQKVAPQVALFAISIMHGCQIQLGGGAAIQLNARPDLAGLLLVEAVVSVPTELDPTEATITLKNEGARADARYPKEIIVPISGGAAHFSAGIFNTSLEAASHCTPDILEHKTWSFPVELTSEGRLGRLA